MTSRANGGLAALERGKGGEGDWIGEIDEVLALRQPAAIAHGAAEAIGGKQFERLRRRSGWEARVQMYAVEWSEAVERHRREDGSRVRQRNVCF